MLVLLKRTETTNLSINIKYNFIYHLVDMTLWWQNEWQPCKHKYDEIF